MAHSTDDGDGIGPEYAAVSQVLFSGNVERKTLLDAACKLGTFCFEAERRGVGRIAGVDRDKEDIEKCRLLANKNGSHVKFWAMDVERDSLQEKYDWVVFLGRLQYLRNPLSVLETLSDCAREVLVVEAACYAADSRRSNFLMSSLYKILRLFPILYLGGSGRKDWNRTNHFFLTENAVEMLFTRHKHSFAIVNFIRSRPGRVMAIAQKRQIEHLVIVAGVPTSGKSTVISRLISGELPELAEQLQFDKTRQWITSGYGDVYRLTEPVIPNMILHFNISTPLVDGDYYGYEGSLLDLIRVSKRTSIVTLWCAPAVLSQRYRENRIRRPVFGVKGAKRKQKNAVLLSLYEHPDRLKDLFAKWFCFVQRRCGDVVIFESSGSGGVMSMTEWQDQ